MLRGSWGAAGPPGLQTAATPPSAERPFLLGQPECTLTSTRGAAGKSASHVSLGAVNTGAVIRKCWWKADGEQELELQLELTTSGQGRFVEATVSDPIPKLFTPEKGDIHLTDDHALYELAGLTAEEGAEQDLFVRVDWD